MAEYGTLTTESTNLSSQNIDKMNALEIARCINNEDKTVAYAVEQCLESIAAAIDLLAEVLQNDGRIFYCGAGTSGRLGVVDASEVPPTYGLYGRVIGLMAGGYSAIVNPAEDAEDNPHSIATLMKDTYHYCEKDVLVAVSASGSANCVKGALQYAREMGTKTVCVTCNKNSDLIPLCDLAIAAEVGPEVINGSTRMKAGTAQKMILNMLSTGAMVRYGRVRGNYMAYMIPSNQKLVARAIRMICQKTGCTPEEAQEELLRADNVIAHAMDAIESKK